MTKRLKIERRRSEIRTRLNEIRELAESARTDAIKQETASLERELRESETELRAAIEEEEAGMTAANGETAEAHQRRELRDRCSVVAYFRGGLSGRLDGAEEELRAELGFEVGEIPLELWERDRPAPEQRTVTNAPGTVGLNLANIAPYVFAPSIAGYMGISMPQVPSGTYAVPTITTALTAGAKAKGADAAATAAAFTVVSSTPKRISARLEFLIEDIAAAGTNLEAALRENLSMALSAELDDQIINGNGTAPNLTGLFQRLTDATADGTALTFDHGLGKLSDLIDGLWAFETMDLRQIVGVDTYKLAAKSVSVPAAGGKGELTLADYMRMHSGGFRTNSRMPATSNTKQKGLAFRAGRPGLSTAVVPTWGRVAIDDPYTNSAKGQRNVSIHVMVGDMILTQPAAYAETEFKVS